MPSKINAITIWATILIFSSCNNSIRNEKILVKKAFENYKTAVLMDMYPEAADCLDKKTIGYYDELSNAIRNTDSIHLITKPFMDKMVIMIVRTIANKNEILSFNGKSLFAFCLKKNLINKEQIINCWIEDIHINQNIAIARFESQKLIQEFPDKQLRQKSAIRLFFYKEEGKWKFSLFELLKKVTPFLKQEFAAQQKQELNIISSIIKELTGENISSEVWNPIK